MSKDYKAAIFDLDGTLLDTLADIGNAANDVLADRGHRTHDLDAYRQFIGDGVATLFKRILPDGTSTPEVIAECVSEFGVTYGRRWNENSQLYPGVRR